jgi:hypothetical protein
MKNLKPSILHNGALQWSWEFPQRHSLFVGFDWRYHWRFLSPLDTLFHKHFHLEYLDEEENEETEIQKERMESDEKRGYHQGYRRNRGRQ